MRLNSRNLQRPCGGEKDWIEQDIDLQQDILRIGVVEDIVEEDHQECRDIPKKDKVEETVEG